MLCSEDPCKEESHAKKIELFAWEVDLIAKYKA